MASKLAISTMSLGRCWSGHPLPQRLTIAAALNYHGIELWHEDLLDLAAHLTSIPPPGPPGSAPCNVPAEAQIAAAQYIKKLCGEKGLEIVCLQPLAMLEGARDRKVAEERREELKLWCRVAQELGTDLIHVASSMALAAELSEDIDLVVEDLRAAADIAGAQEPPIRLSYEALAWGTRIDTWEQSWEAVQKVDRENFGLCLDTFNIAGRIYADPSVSGGVAAGADEAVRESLRRMVEMVDVRRVFFVQVVDAERLLAPLVKGHEYYDASQPCRMSWSRNCRLFYGEQDRGGYLPVREIAEVIFKDVGFSGWVSLELFNRRMNDTGDDVVEELARRGAESWVKLVGDLGLVVEERRAEVYEKVVKKRVEDKRETAVGGIVRVGLYVTAATVCFVLGLMMV